MVLGRAKIVGALQTILLLGWFGLFLIAPCGLMLIQAFRPGGHFSLSLFQSFVHNPVLVKSLVNSVLIALGATAMASFLALPFANWLGRKKLPAGNFFRQTVMLPLLLPPFAGALALRQILGRYGTLNLLLKHAHVLSAPVDWLGGGMGGIIFLEGLHLFPILYFTLLPHFSNLNGDSRDAAMSFGGRNLAYYRKVLLPEISPGFFAGLALVFVWSFTDLGTPLIMEFRQVLPYQAFTMVTDLDKNPMGFALALMMTSVGLSGYWISQALGRRQVGASGKTFRPEGMASLPPFTRNLAITLMAAVLLLASIPIVGLALLAVSKSWFLTALPSAYTFDHFGQLFHHRITRGSLQTSLFLSGLTVLVDLFLGWWLARRVLTGNKWESRILESLAMAPLAIPGIILAFGYVSFFSGTRFDPSGNPLFVLVAAYSMRRLPFTFRSMLTGYRSLPPGIDEAAQTLGQGYWGRLIHIQLPLLTPYILASGLLVFAFSMLEVSDSLILAMREFYYPVTKAMFFLTSRAGDGLNLAAALGMVGMIILALAMWAANRLLGKKFGEMFRG